MKLLLIESDPAILMMLSRFGAVHGWEIHIVSSVAELDALQHYIIPNLILVEDSFIYTSLGNRLRALRDQWSVPCILSVNRDHLPQYSHYLMHEFSDFITRPFSSDELILRMRLLVREVLQQQPFLQIGPLVIDKRKHVAEANGEVLDLTPKQYRLLSMLVEHQGDVLRNDQLYAEIWPDSKRVSDADVQQFIHQLRRRLTRTVGEQLKIENQRGVGYRLVATPARS